MVERRVSVGKVRVELDPGLIAVMGIDAARFTAEAAGPKELAIRGGGGATAKHRRKRLALLLVDQTPERQGIGLVPDMPVRRPGQLAEAGDAARLGHSRQAEIEPIGEEACHEDPRIGGSFTRPQMGEAVGEHSASASSTLARKRSQGITAVIASKASCLLSRAAIRAAPTRA